MILDDHIRQYCAFRHIFSLAHPAATVYIPHGDHFPILEPDVKVHRCARQLRDTNGDGVQERSDSYYVCVEPWASWSRKPSGRDLNERSIRVLSGNRIRHLIRTLTILNHFQSIAYACRKMGCFADSWAVVGSYLETI